MTDPVDLQRRLIEAVDTDDVAGVEAALGDGADPSGLIMRVGDGTPILVRAAERGVLQIVTLLLTRGADVHARAFLERQSMFHDDDTYRQEMSSPVEAAISYGHADVVELLLQHGASPGDAVAASIAKPALLRRVLDRGASPDGPWLGRCVIGGSGEGHLDAIRILLEYGADPNQIGWGDRSVMRNAIEFGRLEAARLLLAAGAAMPSPAEAQKAVDDAAMRSEPAFRERALSTARALGFDVVTPPGRR